MISAPDPGSSGAGPCSSVQRTGPVFSLELTQKNVSPGGCEAVQTDHAWHSSVLAHGPVHCQPHVVSAGSLGTARGCAGTPRDGLVPCKAL